MSHHVVWVEDTERSVVHAALTGNGLTFCGEEVRKDFRFKSLYDFTHSSKCQTCVDMVRRIYNGIISK
jgi:hypothetical protein